MKQANNTEIDRLLQRHGRRWNAAAASTGGDAAGSQSNNVADGAKTAGAGRAHLDADEMSAYAEGALAAPARARSVAHLADCDSCRRIVTDLVLASSVAAEEKGGELSTQDVSPSKSWWSAIAALFAPPVLRYAIPALLLTGVIVVALVATRDRSEPQFVAQRSEEKQADGVSPEPAAPEPSAQISSNNSAVGSNSSSNTPGMIQPGDATPSNQTSQTNANAVSDSSAPVTDAPPAPADARNESPERKQDRETDQIYATEPKAAPPPPPAQTQPAPGVAGKVKEEERLSREQNAQTTTDGTKNAEAMRDKDSAGEDASLASSTAPRQDETAKGAARKSARSRPATGTAGGRAATAEDSAGGSTETRSVGGRRFRRQGNAWIDTAYNSSRSTINVARGSDQYRALAADEPGLRSIAEQLGGEVVVVWKGKAYRIY